MNMTLKQLRRTAARDGLEVWRVRPGPWHAEYGPIALREPEHRGIVASGFLTPGDAAEWIAARH